MTGLPHDIEETVQRALAEDVGAGDLTASIIPADTHVSAAVTCHEEAILCGVPWFEATFRILEPGIAIEWAATEGTRISPGQQLCQLEGPARPMLTGERTALNFLQTLSGTATITAQYAEAVNGTRARILDTRKTLPGLRTAQKYAVRCGGCLNHRMGLHDGILIKENHIAVAGGLEAAIRQARAVAAGIPIEVEVEHIDELQAALEAGADHLLLDNFDDDSLRTAVRLTAGRARLEVSGGVDLSRIRAIAATGIDYISVGALTKHVYAIDMSLRVHRS